MKDLPEEPSEAMPCVAPTSALDSSAKSHLQKLMDAAIRLVGGGNGGLATSEAHLFYGHLKDQKRLERGIAGWFIGHGSEKLGNIAFLVIIICFMLIFGLAWFPKSDDAPFREKTTYTLFSIITLALGYLFGKSSSGSGKNEDPQ
jgi:hypothetical protein